tara:strand:+ start:9264 stop:9596 length:333 start_codon:yes stop_codon:yes gene_type:complete
MRTGQFRYRISIYNMVGTKNEFGEPEIIKQLYKSLRASRKYIGGTTNEVDNTISVKRTIEFTVRFDENILEDMVIEYNGDEYWCKYVFHTHTSTTTMRCVHQSADRFKNE